jgi:isopentenyl-diphosphate delta-isomerase
MEERIVLVNTRDTEVGTEEKIKAHREGKLHRAFSVFVFNSRGEKLLQRRAKTKYHSGGLWTNTCCSHPRPGEPVEEAAHRRLKEEMGFDCELKEVFHFTYRVTVGENLFEHEYDHVFVGTFDGEPDPNPEEIDDWKWIGLEELKREMQEDPDRYTYWLRVVFDRVVSHLKDNVELR